MDIEGTIAISGAGAGLGLGLAVEGLRRGHAVLALIYSEEQRADLLTAASGLADRLDIQVLDITRPGEFTFPAELEILINNAGIRLKNLPIEHVPLNEWRLYLETNFLAHVEMTKRALPVLKARGRGLICNINSGSLFNPIPFLGPYRASKGAMMAFSETLRCEVEQFGIHVLEFLPGAIRTGINKESVTTRIAHAVDYPDYAEMARKQREMFVSGDVKIWEIDDAAKWIMDAIAHNKGRMRHGTDPNSDAGLDGWRPRGGEESLTRFIRLMTPE